MSQVATQYAHIVVGEDGVPRIEGTTTKSLSEYPIGEYTMGYEPTTK